MNDTPIVCYLYTAFDNINSIKDFKNHYQKFNSGYNHELIICFKLLNKYEIEKIVNEIKDLKFQIFIDDHAINDFDFGSYKRVSEKYVGKDILFLNSHSYPICNNWLQILMKHKQKNNIIGPIGSYESIVDSIILKKKYKFISYIIRLLKFKNSFSKFPNPHLRTSSFLINSKLFIEYINDIKINNKFDAWKIESGFFSLTNFFKSNNYDVYVVNSKGEKFSEKDWKLSKTYNYSDQIHLIISDKHSRKYLELTEDQKKKSEKKVWG